MNKIAVVIILGIILLGSVAALSFKLDKEDFTTGVETISTEKMWDKLDEEKIENCKDYEVNFTDLDHVYLLCEKDNEMVSLCQVIDQNETIYKVN